MATDERGKMVSTKTALKDIAVFIRSDEFKGELEAAIPTALRRTLSAERAIRSAWQYISDPKHSGEMARCTTKSVAKAIAEAVTHGLIVDGMSQQAYIVRFKDTAVFMVGYRGKIALMLRGPNIASVNAHTVWEGDRFSLDLATNEANHTPYTILGTEKGRCLGYYAVVTYQTGQRLYEWLSKDEAEKIRASVRRRNHGKDSPAYKEWEHEMGEKAAIHRVGKRVDLDPSAANVFFRDDLLLTRAASEPVTVTADPNDLSDMMPGSGRLDRLSHLLSSLEGAPGAEKAAGDAGGDQSDEGSAGGTVTPGKAKKPRKRAKREPEDDQEKAARAESDPADPAPVDEDNERAQQTVDEAEAAEVVTRLLWWTRKIGEDGYDLFAQYLFDIDHPDVKFEDVKAWRRRGQIDRLEEVMVSLATKFPKYAKELKDLLSAEVENGEEGTE